MLNIMTDCGIRLRRGTHFLREDLGSAYPCMSFHPDGLIVAGGTQEG